MNYYEDALRESGYRTTLKYIYIQFIREATESAQPDWELDVQQRSYFVLITIVSMYGISNTLKQL